MVKKEWSGDWVTSNADPVTCWTMTLTYSSLSEPGFEASHLFPDKQIFLLSFLITLVEAIDLRSNFVKTFTNFISKRLELSFQFFANKQTHSFHVVFCKRHADLFITRSTSAQKLFVDKKMANAPIFFSETALIEKRTKHKD